MSRNCSTSANATISSNLRSISRRAHAEDRAVEVDVLPPGQLGVEAGADLQQAADAAARASTRPSVGSVMRREDLEQRALARAVAADDAERLARLDLEATSRSAQKSAAGRARLAQRPRSRVAERLRDSSLLRPHLPQ